MGRELTEAIVDGILGGGVYALMAVGLTLIFQWQPGQGGSGAPQFVQVLPTGKKIVTWAG